MSQNSINTGYLATLADIVSGTSTRALVNPQSLSGILTMLRAQGAGATINLALHDSGAGLEVRGFGGSMLSSSNPGWIVLPSGVGNANVVYQITANQTVFSTASLLNSTFGMTSGRAWANELPMFVYAAADSTSANPRFFVARTPQRTALPAAALLGQAGSPVTSDQGFYSQSITPANYENMPCVSVGMVTMTKDALDAWTLVSVRPMGVFDQGRFYSFPAGQNGATSGKYLADNGGTAPGFSTQSARYSISRDGLVTYVLTLADTTAPNGVGAVDLQAFAPYKHGAGTSTGYIDAVVNAFLDLPAGSTNAVGRLGNYEINIRKSTTYNTFYHNADFGAGTRSIYLYLIYQTN